MTNILTSIKNIHEARLIRDMSIGIVDVKMLMMGHYGLFVLKKLKKYLTFSELNL